MIIALQRLRNFKVVPELSDKIAALAINVGNVQTILSSHPSLEQGVAEFKALAL